MNHSANQSPLLLYDGYCFLCSNAAKFIRRIDKKKKIGFLALQSTEAQCIIKEHQFPENIDTVLILHRNKLFKKSEAVFEVFSIIGGGWRLLRCFRMVPIRWRDGLYDIIAQNRYRWFGRKDSCQIL